MVGGLADVEEHAAARGRTRAQKLDGPHAGIEGASAMAIGCEFAQRLREIAGVEGLGDRDFIAIDDDGGFAGVADQQGVERAADLGDEREIGANILIRLHGDCDRGGRGGNIQREGTRLVVLEEVETGGLEIRERRALAGESTSVGTETSGTRTRMVCADRIAARSAGMTARQGIGLLSGAEQRCGRRRPCRRRWCRPHRSP